MKRILLFLLLSTLTFGQAWKWDAFQPTTKYGWSINCDGSSEFASVTPSLRLTGKYSLRDDFSVDGMAGVANRGWVVGSGSYTVNNLVDNPLSANDYALVCQTAGVISIPCNQSVGRWSFDLYKGADANLSIVGVINSVGSFTSDNGYRFSFTDLEVVGLVKRASGVSTPLLNSANSYISNSTWYRVTIERNTNGATSVYLNNVLVSTTGGSGTNPVTDNTYTSSNYFVLDLDAGDRISSIVCEYGEGSLDLNSHEKFKFSFDRDMEKANNWVGVSNHSVTDSVTTDKHAGTYSLAMTSSGAGGVGSYIDLPSAYLTPLVAGEKYTLEIWAKATNANCTLTVVIGSKSKSFAVSNSAWTKCPFTFQATSAEVGQMIKSYANQADVVYLDDFSLTRFYPTSISGWFKTSASGANQSIITKTTGSTSAGMGFFLRIDTDNKLNTTFVDGGTINNINLTSDASYADGNWHYFTLVNEYNARYLYVDNSSKTLSHSIGNTNNTQSFTIGRLSYSATWFYSGQLGELQHLKDYAKTQAEHLAEYRNGMKRYNQEQIRIKWKGATDAEMLRDWSGVGNNLSGTNLSTADQQKGTYKAK